MITKVRPKALQATEGANSTYWKAPCGPSGRCGDADEARQVRDRIRTRRA